MIYNVTTVVCNGWNGYFFGLFLSIFIAILMSFASKIRNIWISVQILPKEI